MILHAGAISSAESAKKDQASAAAAAAHTQAPVPPADSAGLQAPHASQQSAATKVPRTTSAPIHATQQQPDVKQVQHPLPSVPVTVGSSETDAAVHADADAAAHDVLQPIDSQADGLAPPQNQLQQSHQGSTADLPCPACLGVLQGPEQVLASVPSSMLAGLPEAEGNAGEWKGCINGGATALAACIRCVIMYSVQNVSSFSQPVLTADLLTKHHVQIECRLCSFNACLHC